MKHGVTGIISRTNPDNETEYLLIRANTDTGEHTGKYYPPSGWVEEGEDEQETIRREFKEELDLDVKVIEKIADLPGDLPDLELHFWRCEIVGGEMKMDEVELNEVGWYTIRQMNDMVLYPATVRLFRDFLHEPLQLNTESKLPPQ